MLLLVALAACDSRVATRIPFTDEEVGRILSLSPVGEVPAPTTNRFAKDERAADLGHLLFFDTRLSANGAIACATCHIPAAGFSDGRRSARGLGELRRNTPSLWGVGHSKWLFWDGRADSLWSQALKPLEAPDEMGSSRVEVWHLIAGDPDLRAIYEGVFGEIPSVGPLPARGRPGDAAWREIEPGDRAAIDRLFSNVGKSIAAYERKLVRTESRFDRFVQGLRSHDPESLEALSEAEQRGLKLFIGRGNCLLCHHGPSLTDGEFHNLGLATEADQEVDVGRYDGIADVRNDAFNGLGEFSDDRGEDANRRLTFVAQKLNNLGEFKTPSLRNVALSAPYMHDGRFASLAEVIEFYSTVDQEPAVGHREESLLPLALTPDEKRDLAAFLESLTGSVYPRDLTVPARR